MKFNTGSGKKTIPMLLSRTAIYKIFNAFTFTLPLSEGQVDEAWEPSNRIIPIIPKNAMSLASPLLSLSSTLLLFFLSYVSLHITLFWHLVLDLLKHI
jgi:hypothetical protein